MMKLHVALVLVAFVLAPAMAGGGDAAGGNGETCPTTSLTGWTEHMIGTRRYLKYVPSGGGSAGVMMFFHGTGGTACVTASASGSGGGAGGGWDAQSNADTYNFVAIAATGAVPAIGGESCCTWHDSCPACGSQDSSTDDVAYVHQIIAEVVAANSVPPDTPRIAIGFSGGAGMAADLGCFDFANFLATATVAMPIVAGVGCASSSGSACSNNGGLTGCTLGHSRGWFGGNGQEIGDSASALTTFANVRGPLGCSTSSSRSTVSSGIATAFNEGGQASLSSPYNCYEYTDCPAAGQLCIYDNFGHVQPQGVTQKAWLYLAGGEAGSGNGPGPGTGTGGTTTGTGTGTGGTTSGGSTVEEGGSSPSPSSSPDESSPASAGPWRHSGSLAALLVLASAFVLVR